MNEFERLFTVVSFMQAPAQAQQQEEEEEEEDEEEEEEDIEAMWGGKATAKPSEAAAADAAAASESLEEEVAESEDEGGGGGDIFSRPVSFSTNWREGSVSMKGRIRVSIHVIYFSEWSYQGDRPRGGTHPSGH